jgi:hypothetical protein
MIAHIRSASKPETRPPVPSTDPSEPPDKDNEATDHGIAVLSDC